MLKKNILISYLFLACGYLLAQHSLSGTVSEAFSGERLSYASIYDTLSQQGTLSNAYGFYSLPLAAGKQVICVALEGFESQYIVVELTKDTLYDIALSKALQTDSVTITDTYLRNAQATGTSRLYIPIQQIQKMPALGGEADVLKSLQLLPGVQFGQEGTTGLFVRGGSPDQNLILLDEMPVYNVSHLFGFFSLFSPETIKSVELIKGGFPAQFGGRLSSVINLQTKEGNRQKWKGGGTISTISVHGYAEGPLLKNKKMACFIAARRTLLDVITRPITAINFRQQNSNGSLGYYFYDLTGKLNYEISEKDHVYFSLYAGQDRNAVNSRFMQNDTLNGVGKVNITGKNYLQWGNVTASLRYHHIFGEKLFGTALLGYTHYTYNRLNSFKAVPVDMPAQYVEVAFKYLSNISDVVGKQNLQYVPNVQHRFLVGAEESLKWFRPDVNIVHTNTSGGTTDTNAPPQRVRSYLLALFGEDNYRLNAHFSAYLGLRAELFGLKNYSHFSLQPRASLRYAFDETFSLKTAYSYIYQYLHLLTNSGLGLPADLWVPATKRAPAASSHQIVLGLYKDLPHNVLLSAEIYYKSMANVIEYKEGASFYTAYARWEDKITVGKSYAYGFEAFAHKTAGKWNGWMSYTLAWNKRVFAEINEGKPFPYRYDRRHNFSVFVTKEMKDPNKQFSVSWMYVSGARTTVPTQIYIAPYQANITGATESYGLGQSGVEFVDIYQFGQVTMYSPYRNNFQLRPFHKLDISYQVSQKRAKSERIWTFGIYNAYARRNPYYVYYKGGPISTFRPQTQQFVFSGWKGRLMEFSYLVCIPAISYGLKW